MDTVQASSSNSKNMKSETHNDTVTVQDGSNSKDMESETHNDTVVVQDGSNSKDMESETHNDTVSVTLTVQDSESKRLVESALTMMVCVQECRISAVPKRLGKSQVKDVYTPRAVSIGLLHRGASTDLLHMEDIKWRSMFYLLHRTDDMMVSLKKCTKLILRLDEKVRASYNVNEFKYNSYDLAKIMLSDGCFLLELLIRGSPQLNAQLKCRLEVPKRLAEVSKREVVLSDLTLLENQIPLVILTELARELFDVRKMETMLTLFGYSSDSGVKSSNNPAHILELVHSFTGREITNLNDNREGKQVRVNINTKNHPNPKPKLKLCATKLEAAGVTLKPPEKSEIGKSDMKKIRFDLKIKFDSRSVTKTLEIPQLHITETTEAKWKNFIAWELTKNEDAKSTDENGSIFIWYALFFQGLLCSVEDIQLLRDKGIIVVHDAQSGEKLMTNEELLIFFGNLTEGVDDDQVVEDSYFSGLFQDLNSLPTPLDCIIMWHVCRRDAPRVCHFVYKYNTKRWKGTVSVAAVLTIALTFIQTFFPDPFHFH